MPDTYWVVIGVIVIIAVFALDAWQNGPTSAFQKVGRGLSIFPHFPVRTRPPGLGLYGRSAIDFPVPSADHVPLLEDELFEEADGEEGDDEAIGLRMVECAATVEECLDYWDDCGVDSEIGRAAILRAADIITHEMRSREGGVEEVEGKLPPSPKVH